MKKLKEINEVDCELSEHNKEIENPNAPDLIFRHQKFKIEKAKSNSLSVGTEYKSGCCQTGNVNNNEFI